MTTGKDVDDLTLINVDRSAIVFFIIARPADVGEKDFESKSNKEHSLPLAAAMKIEEPFVYLDIFKGNCFSTINSLTTFARPARGWLIPLLYLMYQRARIPWMLFI